MYLYLQKQHYTFMKTEVAMTRELFGMPIKQKSKSEFFSATDLVRAGNKWRATNGLELFNFHTWRNNTSTKEFISEMESQYGTVLISGRGRGNDTWVHPFIFLDLALSINPTLKITVYKWLYDSLLKYRNSSGDSYKKMTGTLFDKCTNKSAFALFMVNLAKRIQSEVGVRDWQSATEGQLLHRDKIHEYIDLFASMATGRNVHASIDIAFEKAREYKSIKP